MEDERVIYNNISLSIRVKKTMYLFVKRFFDIIFSLVGCICLIPVIVIVKIVNMVNGDFGPVFYTHLRVGKNGKIFKFYKFRTMVMNSQEILEKLLKQKKYREEWKKYQKLSNDPRITKVGKFLRKSSLDELPQFINILKGDMSLIGPRPLIPGELESHGGNPSIYQSVKPGLTGWWACNGRSANEYDKRLELEYYYAKNCSIRLDIKCVLLTIKTVIKKTGAK